MIIWGFVVTATIFHKVPMPVEFHNVWNVRFYYASRQWLRGKESACNAGDPGSAPKLGGSPGEENGYLYPVFLPGESHGQRSLAGYGSWGHKDSDTTEHHQTVTARKLSVLCVSIMALVIFVLDFIKPLLLSLKMHVSIPIPTLKICRNAQETLRS